VLEPLQINMDVFNGLLKTSILICSDSNTDYMSSEQVIFRSLLLQAVTVSTEIKLLSRSFRESITLALKNIPWCSCCLLQ